MYDALPDPIFAPDPSSRREPSASERANGFSCGPFDRSLFNHLQRLGLTTQAEVANMVKRVGLLCNPEDMHQLGEAALRMHRVVEDTTLIVGPGSQFGTLADVMEYLSPLAIPYGVDVTIQLLDFDYQLDSTTGPWNASHPFGSRIFIRGQPLIGAGFPTIEDARQAAPATMEAMLRGRFPTVIECEAVDGLFIEDHSIKLIENVLFVGSFTGQNKAGIRVGERITGEAGRGILRATQCWSHGFSGQGVIVRYTSSLTGYRIGTTHNTTDGFRTTNSSSANIEYGCISTYNGQKGWYSFDGSEFQISQKGAGGDTNHTEFNGQAGAEARNNSIMKFFNATVANNGGGGCSAVMSATVNAETITFTGNLGGYDLKANDGGMIRCHNTSPASPTCNPAAGTSGSNHNSYIGLGVTT